MGKEKHPIHEWGETYTEDMFHWAFHKVSHQELAQDLVQDTFLAATEKIRSSITITKK